MKQRMLAFIALALVAGGSSAQTIAVPGATPVMKPANHAHDIMTHRRHRRLNLKKKHALHPDDTHLKDAPVTANRPF